MTKHIERIQAAVGVTLPDREVRGLQCADVRAQLAEREALLAACEFFNEECPVEHGIEQMILSVPYADRPEREEYLMRRLEEARAAIALANGKANS